MIKLNYFLKKRKLKRGMERLVNLFVHELEFHNKFNKKLYDKILDLSDTLDKRTILDTMIEDLKVFTDYHDEAHFDCRKYIRGLNNES